MTGGVRSGKSRFALAAAMPGKKRVFIATATACDAEMAQRIARHRKERVDDFLTIEEPLDLAGALRSVPAGTDVAVVDCLTVWLGNLMHHHGATTESFEQVGAFLGELANATCHVIIVTNEVGMGIVPDTEMGRRFRDLAGNLNAGVAQIADDVVLLVSGIPLAIKGTTT